MSPRQSKRRTQTDVDEKKDKEVALPYLDDLVVVTFLSWLPAVMLNSTMRVVCRRWEGIIRDPQFIKIHKERSKAGLFIQSHKVPYAGSFLEVGKFGNYEVTNMSTRYPGQILTSSGGICIFERSGGKQKFILGNPVTQEYRKFPEPWGLPGEYDLFSCAIIHDPHTGVYTLVWTAESFYGQVKLYLLRLGVGQRWKEINKDGSLIFRVHDADPLAIGRFLFWTRQNDREILFLDTSDESVHLLRIPRGRRTPLVYLQKGEFLSTVTLVSSRACTHHIHILKDPLAGTWVLYHKVDLSTRIPGEFPRSDETFIRFFGWANNNEDLILRAKRDSTLHGNLAYNMKTRKIRSIGDLMYPCEHVKVHANVLVRLQSEFERNG